MNGMVWLGGVLIAIGFVIVVRPGNLPGRGTNAYDPLRLPFPPPMNRPEPESLRRKRSRVLAGLGVLALGGVCIALGA